MIDIKVDKQQLAALLGKLEQAPKALATATSRAINKTLTSTRAEMVRTIRTDYSIKAGDIRKELAIRQANPNQLVGKVGGESSPGVPLIRFARTKMVPSTRRTKGGGYTPKSGIPVLIKKATGKKIFKRAFIVQLKSGHVGAFVRADPGKSGRLLKGTNIRVNASKLGKRYFVEKYGPTPIKLLGAKANLSRIDAFARSTMDKNLKHEAEFILSKIGLK
jgi:hypothetical protein